MKRILEIFVSSPGDLADERRVVAEIVGRLARAPHVLQRGYSLRAHLYEDIVPPVIADGPQDAINTFMLDPARCDVLVCLLGDRLGTKMRDPRHRGETFVSGTVYEATAASESSRRPRPQILMYYRRTPRDGAIAADRQQVDEFVSQIVSGQGRLRGIAPAAFQDGRDLAGQLAAHLDATVTHLTRLHEMRRRRTALAGVLVAVALCASGYRLSNHIVESAYERGRADEGTRDVEFLSNVLAKGPVEAIGGLNRRDCGVVPTLMAALGALQPVGDLPTIKATIEALKDMASSSRDPSCGCDQLLGVLRTRDLPVRYCQGTHEMVLEALQNLGCADKARVIREYVGKIRARDSFKNVFCNIEIPGPLDQLESKAVEALGGPKTSELQLER